MSVNSIERAMTREIGDRVKTLRQVQGVTLVGLAGASGLHRLAIAAIENGKRQSVTAWEVARLAEALGVTAASLLGEAATGKSAADVLREIADRIDPRVAHH